MSLYVIATPIGVFEDLGLRAIEIIRSCHLVIGEERKPVARLLKAHALTPKKIELLNEHSDQQDVNYLVELCKDHEIALVSDCGTPGFCDPGTNLVAQCRSQNIKVSAIPGPSSLMAFISVCGRPMNSFLFRGFLPANSDKRAQEWLKLKKNLSVPVILMDTPYRLNKMLDELTLLFPMNLCTLGLCLSTPEEALFSGKAKEISQKVGKRKAEFILLLEPLS